MDKRTVAANKKANYSKTSFARGLRSENYTPSEIDMILNASMSDYDIAVALNRSEMAINIKRSRLNIKKGKRWKPCRM